MPTLEQYADSSPKSGVYILANVGGGHPITLQVTTVGQRILEKAGYADDDAVPNKVVWAMYDVGLLYTAGTIDNIPDTPAATEEIFTKLNVGNLLTAAERKRLLGYLRDYTGPNQAQVESLAEKLEKDSPATQATESDTTSPEPTASSADLNVAGLSDADPEVRKSAVKSFARTAREQPAAVAPHLDALIPRLDDPDKYPTKWAFRAFEEVGKDDPDAVAQYYDVLASFLASDNPPARKFSTAFFARLASRDPDRVANYLDQLAPRLDDPEKYPTKWAFQAFEEVGKADPTAVSEYHEQIASYLESDNPHARKYATAFFARLASRDPAMVSTYLDQLALRLDDPEKYPTK